MAADRRVVLTGLGVLTPIGIGAGAYWDSLAQGRSGIRRIRSIDVTGLPSPIAGEIDGFDPKQYIDKKERKSLRVMARTIQLGVAAAQLAMVDAKISKDKLDATRLGVSFGSGVIPSELHELGPASQASVGEESGTINLKKWGELGVSSIQPL